MNTLSKTWALASLLLASGISLSANDQQDQPQGQQQDQQKEDKLKKAAVTPEPGVAALKKQLRRLDLSAEQTEKIEAVLNEFAPKYREAQKEAAAASRDLHTERAKAVKKALAQAETSEEPAEAITAAVKGLKGKKSAVAAANKRTADLQQKARKDIAAILTARQREQVGWTEKNSKDRKKKVKNTRKKASEGAGKK